MIDIPGLDYSHCTKCGWVAHDAEMARLKSKLATFKKPDSEEYKMYKGLIKSNEITLHNHSIHK